jgi:cytochrome P450
LKKNGKLIDFLLLSSAEYTDAVYNSVHYLARGSAPYIGYCYGRVAGYTNGTFAYGLAGIDGPLWWRHRAVVNEHVVPTFRTPRIANIYNHHAVELTHRINAQLDNPMYDPTEDLRDYLFDVNLRHIFGEYMDSLEPEYTYKLYNAIWTFNEKFQDFYTKSYPWGILQWHQQKLLDEQLDIVGDFLTKVIKHKKDTGIVGDDWLGILAHSLVNGTFLDTEELKTITYDLLNGNSAAFLFASKYTLYLLATHPEIQEALYKELKTCLPNNELTIANMHNCPLLLGVVNESLRLFPGGGAIGGRFSTEAYNEGAVIGGYQIPPKVVIMTNVQRIQTDERYWGKDAKQFNPHRWDNGFKPVAGSYLPFGGGLKGCVGAPVARLGVAVTTAHVVKNFEFSFTGQEPPVVRNIPVATMTSEYHLNFQLRDSSTLKDEL